MGSDHTAERVPKNKKGQPIVHLLSIHSSEVTEISESHERKNRDEQDVALENVIEDSRYGFL